MSVKSVNHQKSGFTPYQNSLQQKQLSLFSRLNLNENDKSSLQNPMRNFGEYEYLELYSMRSRKRKGSAEIQLKESLPGNKTYLNVSLIGKSSLLHNDLFGHEHYQDLGLGEEYYDEKKEFSQKSCPVCPSYNVQQNSKYQKKMGQVQQNSKPRFHKTKNLLRTIASYLHKFILHNKRSSKMKRNYFRKIIERKMKKQEQQQNFSLLALGKIKLEEEQDVKQEESNKGSESSSGQQKYYDEEYYLNQLDKYDRKEFDIKTVQKTKKIKKNISKSKTLSNEKEQFLQQKVKQEYQESEHQHSELIIPTQKLPQSSKSLQNPTSKLSFAQIQKQLQIQQQIQSKTQKFHTWISSLSLINFADYQKLWSQSNNQFVSLYRQICYKYYKEEVYCDVMRSRLTTKDISNRYMHQFLQGLFHPKQFYRFR